MEKISRHTINRLIVYKKILNQLKYDGVGHVFSHILSKLTGFSSAQIRRDLMFVGYTGSPARGYEVSELEDSISKLIDDPQGLAIAVVGVGKLGSSLLDHCYWHCQNLKIIVGFDIDEKKIGKSDNGYFVHHIDDMAEIIQKEKIYIGVISCPMDIAQHMAERLVEAGVRGILNYSQIKLDLPENIYVEDMDLIVTLERVSYFTRNHDLFKKRSSI